MSNKIPIYRLSDLSVQKVEELIEKGEVFDVESSILSKPRGSSDRDAFWDAGDKHTNVIRNATEGS